MAKRRRSTAARPNKRPRADRNEGKSTKSPVEDDPAVTAEEGEGEEDDEDCPECKRNNLELNDADKESWIECGHCNTWYHWRCAGNGGDLETVDKWYCSSCIAKNPQSLVNTFKAVARKSGRTTHKLDYSQMDSGLFKDANRWARALEGKTMSEKTFKVMKGGDVGIDWVESDPSAMLEPFIVETPDGLGMKMPDSNFTVEDVAETVGRDTLVEVIDVASQSASHGWNLGKWADYYAQEPSTRDKILNVISLEISGTKLADQVLPPRLVRELDWVEKFWPAAKKNKGNPYPKVQLYCLMGIASAWTDWHIDFAGSSVYYHVLRGSKVFFFIAPTAANLAAYERWSGSDIQNHSWLGDMVDEVVKVTLVAGNTMIIPTGWIHAVYTPVDSLVFGGNFLHSYNVKTQLKVREIEISTKVPKKFRFPFFTKLCWYVGEKYLRDLKGKEELSTRVLDSIEVLSTFLVAEARKMERGSESAKREAREQIPGDRIKDAPALARELRWRVRLASGLNSDDDGSGMSRVKGKRGAPAAPTDLVLSSKFRNFRPAEWDAIEEKVVDNDKWTTKAPRPNQSPEWKAPWVSWHEADATLEGTEGDEVLVKRRQEMIVKVRRTAAGLERQRVERVFEEWDWSDTATAVDSSLKSEAASGTE